MIVSFTSTVIILILVDHSQWVFNHFYHNLKAISILVSRTCLALQWIFHQLYLRQSYRVYLGARDERAQSQVHPLITFRKLRVGFLQICNEILKNSL